MRMYDIIYKKRMGLELSDEEISFFVGGYTSGDIPDYQAAALAMAIVINGMTERETVALTLEMSRSGDIIDLSSLGDRSVDKHSTGGVGDKTTLIVAPTVAALGAKVAKMSGRGLGHTGGTVDKLESIKGYRTSLIEADFISQVERIGVAVIGQTGNLAPCDKKLYALRDVTATVDSIPLITSSIMSKKIAAGSRSIVLDIKVGSGAFMKTPEDAETLGRMMINIGSSCGRRVSALITNMDVPLGNAVGNSLEVMEAIAVLRGEKGGDLREVCEALAANMVSLSLERPLSDAEKMVKQAIDSGAAYEKFKEWIAAQGGDVAMCEDVTLFPSAPVTEYALAEESGYIGAMNSETIGTAAVLLGAGRGAKDDVIDMSAGIELMKKTGDPVEKGERIAALHTSDSTKATEAKKLFGRAITYSAEKPKPQRLIYKTLS